MQIPTLSSTYRNCVFLAVALLAAALAAGETPAEQDLTTLSLEELAQVKVFTASRHLEDARKAPSAVSVITSDEIARYGWRTLGEVLGSVRGFYTAYDRNYTYVGVRGFLQSGDYNARILLLINGHRVNENVYDSAMIGTEFPLDLDLIERVEIVRGPSSSMYGTNAELAVVNVITRQPRESAIEVAGGTASFLGRTGRLTTTVQQHNFSALFSGSLYRSDGPARLFYPEFATPENNNGFAENIDGDRYAQAFADAQWGKLRVQGSTRGVRRSLPQRPTKPISTIQAIAAPTPAAISMRPTVGTRRREPLWTCVGTMTCIASGEVIRTGARPHPTAVCRSRRQPPTGSEWKPTSLARLDNTD
jgi:iron complex outermembrane receptor protein